MSLLWLCRIGLHKLPAIYADTLGPQLIPYVCTRCDRECFYAYDPASMH